MTPRGGWIRVTGRSCGRLYRLSREGLREHRDVAQFGSALDWGSRGRRFESGRPDGNEALTSGFAGQGLDFLR